MRSGHVHTHETHCCEPEEQKFKLGKKLKFFGLIFLIVLAISFLPILKDLNQSLLSYLGMIWWAILLGLLIGGVIDYFIPDGFIFKYLGSRKKSAIWYAVIAGFLMSACSHGILAIAIQLHKKGASIPAVITFLLASPWANLPVTILLFGFFGVNALLFVLAAMTIAIITGHIFIFLEKSEWIETSPEHSAHSTYSWERISNFNLKASINGVIYGALNLANMILWWIIIGFLIAAVIGAYVPHEFLMNYFGPGLTGLLLTLAVATVIEICSEGSAPIAFEIFKQVGALGNPFVFLMAGVVTDYTEIGLIWTSIGKRTAIWLPIITVPQVVFVGFLMNLYL